MSSSPSRIHHYLVHPLMVDPDCSTTAPPLGSIPLWGTSTLLRVVPSLCTASVLWPSWGFHLGVSLGRFPFQENPFGIGAPGSHVPHHRLQQVQATSMPDAASSISRYC